MLNVRNGGYSGYFPIEPTPPATRSGPFPHVDGLTGIHTANIVSYGQFDRNRNVTAATLTRYADHFAGKSHEFKFGFEFERSKIRNESGYPGGRYYYDYGGPYEVYLWNGYVTNATAKRTSVYAQDTWTLDRSADARTSACASTSTAARCRPARCSATTPGAPRLGLAFDVTGDHQTVVRGQLRPLLRRAVRRPVRVHGSSQQSHENHGGGARARSFPGAERGDSVHQRRHRSEHQAVVRRSVPRRHRAAAVPGFLADRAVHQPPVPRLHGLHRHRLGLRAGAESRSRARRQGPARPTMASR